jgi:hypothetical protein
MVDDDIVLVYEDVKMEVTETCRAFEQTKMFPLLRRDNFLRRITACEKKHKPDQSSSHEQELKR